MAQKLPNVNIHLDPFAALVKNINIQIDPFATLVPKLPNVNIQIDPFATWVPKLPHVIILIDPFATLVPKCQYSDRIHSQSVRLGLHLAGAVIRTRNHNYEDRNHDLNAHPQFDFQGNEPKSDEKNPGSLRSTQSFANLRPLLNGEI